MFILAKLLFHFICSIGRFSRKIFFLIVGRRHEELGLAVSKTEPVTLEHIRIISDMENDSHRPYQSVSSIPKIPQTEWNSWGAQDIFRQKAQANQSPTADSAADNIDYFTDIAATVKKTPKIILKKRLSDKEIPGDMQPSHHNRLQMSNDDLVDFQPGLSEWNDEDKQSAGMTGGTWDDQDDFNGLSIEATEALRESRRIDREKKLREHQQRKLDKEASRSLGHKRESFAS